MRSLGCVVFAMWEAPDLPPASVIMPLTVVVMSFDAEDNMFADPDHSSRGLKASAPKWPRTALTFSIKSPLHRTADPKKMQESGSR
jgi:hypothetical protein